MQKNFITLLQKTFSKEECDFYCVCFSKRQKNKYSAYFLNYQRYKKKRNTNPTKKIKSPTEYLEMQHNEGMTFEQIGFKLGISHHCVRENFLSGMKKIKAIVESNSKYKDLKDFLY